MRLIFYDRAQHLESLPSTSMFTQRQCKQQRPSRGCGLLQQQRRIAAIKTFFSFHLLTIKLDVKDEQNDSDEIKYWQAHLLVLIILLFYILTARTLLTSMQQLFPLISSQEYKKRQKTLSSLRFWLNFSTAHPENFNFNSREIHSKAAFIFSNQRTKSSFTPISMLLFSSIHQVCHKAWAKKGHPLFSWAHTRHHTRLHETSWPNWFSLRWEIITKFPQGISKHEAVIPSAKRDHINQT